MKTTRISIAVLALLLLLGGCAGKGRKTESFEDFAYGKQESVAMSADQYAQMADNLLRSGKPELAFVHYNKALELDPENSAVRVRKGTLLVEKGLDEQGLAEFLKVLEMEPDNSLAHQEAGTVYFRAGLYREAREHLNRAVELNPMLWKAHNYLGILSDRAGNYVEAEKRFRSALDLHQGHDKSEIHNNLGVVHLALAQYDRAVDEFRSALAGGGLNARTYNNLGLALARLGRLDQALESFKYAGGEARANNNLGYVLLTDGRPAEAVPYFERAVELSPAYYVKAADNLKRARLAARFVPAESVKTDISKGSTPNHLLRKPFPKVEQNPGASASPAAADAPTGKAVHQVALKQADGESIKGRYGLHVSSWRDHEWAFAHCEQLRKQGYSTWINQVELGEKGVWYRVMVGRYASAAEAVEARPGVLADLKLERAPAYPLERPAHPGEAL
ncbi:SPOR domain-containing protein [Pseudodesulfovibrio tunisiensis]|uniref:SPOR domain-containing protein n=1 Tax=Pseudodesulfovibrio tunisiensis TaxID=463192 RepID=UPI001FB31DF8|nr:tetratricopeptide repeat protein [Pseudodesulfovibrio tunisiensis]